jgi:hypothetical protein
MRTRRLTAAALALLLATPLLHSFTMSSFATRCTACRPHSQLSLH